jgi:hypothetical protein
LYFSWQTGAFRRRTSPNFGVLIWLQPSVYAGYSHYFGSICTHVRWRICLDFYG